MNFFKTSFETKKKSSTEKSEESTKEKDDKTAEKTSKPTVKKDESTKGTTDSQTTDCVNHITMADSSHTLNDGSIIHYKALKPIGKGSFGVVFQALIEEKNQIVAIKKTLQDSRYRNREIHIMKRLSHNNIVSLRHCFYSPGEHSDELYLNLVLEYIPETIYIYAKRFQFDYPLVHVKYWMYQILQSLSYIHSLGICHRDIKPQNLLIYPDTLVVKLCDFGSAKILQKNEANVSYICSRYYRAPELIFGATDYTFAIDIWSLGCVFAELLLSHPIFPGQSGVDQLVEIIKVLGTPKKEDVIAMNSNYMEYAFPDIKPQPWSKIFSVDTPKNCLDLISKMLEFNPEKRIDAITALSHPFFDELREPNFLLPYDIPVLSSFYTFTAKEMMDIPNEIREKLIPIHARNETTWPVNTEGQRVRKSREAERREKDNEEVNNSQAKGKEKEKVKEEKVNGTDKQEEKEAPKK